MPVPRSRPTESFLPLKPVEFQILLSLASRVRFETENFERRIVESDIDVIQSASSVPNIETVASAETGSWLKSSSIKVRK